ncbi:MAG: hypothetical protein EP330_10030 [Deltaproteobacteria bacterium]|nr:MAG: hypothetical protein EP330_10030 [Deltaproteobacteria bacterium]
MAQMLLVMLFFAACMGAMAIGVVVSNRELQSSCGGAGEALHEVHGISCGACVKKENEVCPSDDPLVALAQIGHPNPKHHR